MHTEDQTTIMRLMGHIIMLRAALGWALEIVADGWESDGWLDNPVEGTVPERYINARRVLDETDPDLP